MLRNSKVSAGSSLRNYWSRCTCFTFITNTLKRLREGGAVSPQRPLWARVGDRADLRLRVGGFVALEGMGEVVLVAHVAVQAQVVIEADFALPSHSANAVFLATIADDVRVADP